MMRIISIFLLISLCFGQDEPYVIVLGVAQDGGIPHAGCEKTCCNDLWDRELHLNVASYWPLYGAHAFRTGGHGCKFNACVRHA